MDTCEFNRLMKHAHMNDDPYGILNLVYDNELPHPFFDPDQVTFSKLLDFNTNQWIVPDRQGRTVIWECCEGLLPSKFIKHPSLDKDDIVLTVTKTAEDNQWPCLTAFNPYDWIQVNEVNNDCTLKEFTEKPFIADVLLGKTQYPHKFVVLEYLKNNNLINKDIVSYSTNYTSDFIINDQTELEKFFQNTDQSTDNFHGAWVSHHIPQSIYDASYISFVVESQEPYNIHYPKPSVFFPTEKIGKPLLSGRIFLGIFTHNFLARLRELGLKTFDGIINEEYDSVQDTEKRIQCVLDEFARLHNEDMFELYTKAKPILEHNHKLISNKKWLTQQARNILQNYQTPV